MSTNLPETTALVERNEGVKALLLRANDVVDISDEVKALVKSGVRVQQLLDRVADDLEIGATLIVDSPEMLEEAQTIRGRLATVASDSGEIERERKALVGPLNSVVKMINAGYNAPREHIKPVMDGLGAKILAYHQEQQRILAQREANERAERLRIAREASEAEAAAQAKADALIAEAKKAQGSGSQIVAQELAAQAGQSLDAARQTAVAAVQEVRTAPVFAAAPAAKGVRGTWTVEQVNLDNLILHIAKCLEKGDRSLVGLLRLDEVVARRLVSAQQAGFNVPGLRAECKSSVQAKKVAL